MLAVGPASPAQDAHTFVRVIALDPVGGTLRWTFTDNVSNFGVGLGMVVARDGGIDVSANYAVPDSSPWSLLRIGGPFADGIFANGYEE